MKSINTNLESKIDRLQLEKERLIDIHCKLSKDAITPEEENTCLHELEKASTRWHIKKGVTETIPLKTLTVESFINLIQSARAQMTVKDLNMFHIFNWTPWVNRQSDGKSAFFCKIYVILGFSF